MSIDSSLRKTSRRRTASFLGMLLLIAMLGITTYAVTMATLELKDNYFKTGTVDIEFTQDTPYFDGADDNVEAGYSMAREIGVQNVSSTPIYYKLYLDGVRGNLAHALVFRIYSADEARTLLYEARADELTENGSPFVSEHILDVDEVESVIIVATVDSGAGNAYQNGYMDFNLVAKAVQVKNNVNIEFD